MKKPVMIIAGVIFLLGLGILLFPHIYGCFFGIQSDMRINEFVNAYNLKHLENDADKARESDEMIHKELYNAMLEYNTFLYTLGQDGLKSIQNYEKFAINLKDYGIDNEMIGYLDMPTLGLEFPIYLGADHSHLDKGVAIMGNTSAPIGGNNTNCVIAGHSTWKGAKRFTNILNLKVGDEIHLVNFWEKRTYLVKDCAIIDENDFSNIYIRENEDMVTLVTCHYVKNVKKRYIVFCEYAER